jgi:cellulose synthase/poly-beta-1,6-N-acetylglucosamine synthase-like glycosyltransferase
MVIIIITSGLLLCYAFLIFYYKKKFDQLKTFYSERFQTPLTNFSIIIAARNEEDAIGECLKSIFKNKYSDSLFEVIVVDDHSTDKTVEVVKTLQVEHRNLKLIKLSEVVNSQLNSYKKKAIEVGIGLAQGEWIITTDADCTIPSNWLINYDQYIQKYEPVFIAAPVMFNNTGSFVSIFQCLDFISLQGITAAAVSAGFHSLCNGANLAYRKDAFFAVEGFKNIDNLASGDDMFLMQKMKMKFDHKIVYLFSQEAIVKTLPMPDWRSFINQRIRWASKADSYSDKRIVTVLSFVYLLNLMLFILPFISFLYPPLLWYWLGLVLLKTLIELPFMYSVATFHNMKKLLWWFPLMQPIHIAYTVIAGWLGKFGKYRWKGRVVK